MGILLSMSACGGVSGSPPAASLIAGMASTGTQMRRCSCLCSLTSGVMLADRFKKLPAGNDVGLCGFFRATLRRSSALGPRP
jgi:hypothetical protein